MESLFKTGYNSGQLPVENKNGCATPLSFSKNWTSNGSRSSSKKAAYQLPKTPVGDRFIPMRSAMSFDVAYYKTVTEKSNKSSDAPTEKELNYRRALSMCLAGCDIDKARVLAYKKKPPITSNGYQNELEGVYDHERRSTSAKKSNRYIPSNPDRILDAPEIRDDFYLNLLDWSSKNILAIALNDHVYLWDSNVAKVQFLMQVQVDEQYVSSVSWSEDGNYLAVGTSTGSVELWDVKLKKRVREFKAHTSSRVGALSWNQYVLTTGSRNGKMNNHDVRVPNHLISSLNAHTQEICGLRWSPNGRYLASGGNDNLVNIWPSVSNECHPVSKPIYSLNQHTSAVKALAWCPWHSSTLATGGGTADKSIKFWNCNTGECINSIGVNSQVSSLLWSTNYKEIISSHGYPKIELAIWKYPAMTKVTKLTGHVERILGLAMSPVDEVVASAAADETVCIWKCFSGNHEKSKRLKLKDPTDAFFMTIR